jgi:selenocysteine lyase/cysteine desulfurase
MGSSFNRREFLKSSAALAALATVPVIGFPSLAWGKENRAADNEAYWATVRAQYAVTDEVTNLEAGYWGIMSIPTTKAFIKNTEFLNLNNTHYVRRKFFGDQEAIIERLAKKLGVGADELVLTRNATESLRCLMTQYNKLKPGDTVIYADTDYGSMQTTMAHLGTLRGANVVKLATPEPATHNNLMKIYENAIIANPTAKLMLVTHISNRSGTISPAKEITAMARKHGVDVILDAAHSWGQFDFDFQDLGVDFCGFNLHKWIAAPLGVGLMYIRKSRILDISPQHGEAPADSTDIQNRVHPGTMSFASVLTIPTALDFQESIGIENISNRLRYLRNTWVDGVKDNPKVEVTSLNDDTMHAGITSFRIKGITTGEENAALVKRLTDEYGIFTVNIGGIAKGPAIRVSPALYNSGDDARKLATAINEIAG